METNMKGKVTVLILYAMLLALCLPAEAQQAAKVPRIGYVSATGDPSNPGPNVEGFRQGLRDFGYVEGKNILVEYRYVEGKGDRNPSLVAELVQLKVDVLVVGGPGEPRRQAGDQDDSHCHRDTRGPSRGWVYR